MDVTARLPVGRPVDNRWANRRSRGSIGAVTHQDWLSCVRWMSAHRGLATREQMRGMGLSDRTIARRVDQGMLVPVEGPVFALPGLPLDLAARTHAAVMALPSAIPTGPSAAVLLGSGPWDGLDLGQRPWLLHRRSRAVNARYVSRPSCRTVRAAGVLVASPRDAVVDLARGWPYEDALQVTQRALQLRVLTFADLIAAHASMPRYSGSAQLARVIATLADGTRSEAERLLVRLLREAGIGGWSANHRVRALGRSYDIDVAFAKVRLAVEVDGRAFHSDSRSFQRDRRRQNDLVSAGWTVLRFTWADLTEHPESVIARILDALHRLAA